MARKVHRGESHREQLLAEEVPRLSGVLADSRRICIVEQYVGTHNTLYFAHRIVSEATAQGAFQTDIRGKYYHLVDRDDVDLGNVTSTHSEFMRQIGARAASSVITP
jgi:hypothetical protein